MHILRRSPANFFASEEGHVRAQLDKNEPRISGVRFYSLGGIRYASAVLFIASYGRGFRNGKLT